MWFKIVLLVIIGSTLSATTSIPKKPFRSHDLGYLELEDEEVITPLVDPDTGINYRLPNNTSPMHYEVFFSTHIHLGMEGFNFEGNVRIKILAIEETSTITLHHRQLEIGDIYLLREGGATWQSNLTYEYEVNTNFLQVQTRLPIPANTIFWLTLDFKGTLRGDQAGFYRSSYLDTDENRRWLAITQFESTDARHGFPCFDEPGIRSTFEISIRHHGSYSAVSNMPVVGIEREPLTDYVITTFETTPPVQSYLVAYMVSDFLFAEDLDSITPQRVYAKPQSILNEEYQVALNVAGPLLDTFGHQYLRVPFSLPKMDQAAIPDFAAGAMENWGLVTYREQSLLFNPKTGTTSNQEGIESTIAHEFAHQHFGNLVSPAWWHFLWLNEGFATLYAENMLHLVYPDGRWMDSFHVDTFQAVMGVDANPNIRAMTHYVENPRSISGLFDNVAYSKSGSVLRMFQNAFNDQTWAKGLNRYLMSNAYHAVTSSHLYAGIQEAVNEDWPINTPDVALYMSSWELQAGFPYVNVSRSGDSLVFQQDRFMYADRNSENLWWIPVSYRIIGRAEADNSASADFWIPNQREFTVNGATAPRTFTSSDLVLINYQQSGYYRVNYDTELWNEFIEVINNEDTLSNIHLLNRAQLIDDSFHLARADIVDFDILLGLMNYLEMETDYLPWVATNRVNSYVSLRLLGTEVYPHYEEFMRKNAEAVFVRLGADIIDNEPRVDRYTRSIAMNIACSMHHPECLTATNARLQQALIEYLPSRPLHQDLFNSLYCNGIRTADIYTFDRTLSKALRSSTSTTERNAILTGLGCVHDLQILEMYFDFALGHEGLSGNDRSRILTSAYNNGEASVRFMIQYVADNYERINQFNNLLNTVCSNIAIRIFNQEMHEEFSNLLDTLESVNVINENQRNTYNLNALTLLDWQSTYLTHFERFFM